MAKKYEYHKQNDYPGERIAERERVADRKEASDKKSDARVAEKSRTAGLKAERVHRRRNFADTIGLAVIAGLILILVAGSVVGLMEIKKQSDTIDVQSSEIDSLNLQLDRTISDNKQLSIANRQTCAATDKNPPTILYMTPLTSVLPSNNAVNVAVRVPITVMFSEDMDPSTINTKTFIVEQRTTPKSGSEADQYRSLPIKGTVIYSDRKATFTSDERFQPNQIYGNVFTAIITKGAKDIAGNSLVNNYVWSFTTGEDAFNTGITTSQTG
jgi:hypothetical protein